MLILVEWLKIEERVKGWPQFVSLGFGVLIQFVICF